MGIRYLLKMFRRAVIAWNGVLPSFLEEEKAAKMNYDLVLVCKAWNDGQKVTAAPLRGAPLLLWHGVHVEEEPEVVFADAHRDLDGRVRSGANKKRRASPEPSSSKSKETRKKIARGQQSQRGSGSLAKNGKKRVRAVRCGQCPGCLASNCGKCRRCLDMPAFGGRGKLKQACVKRRCINLLK
jgi:hypothetical protein